MEASTGVRPPLAGPAEWRPRARRRSPEVLARAAARHAADWPRTTRVLPWALFGFMAMIWLIPFDSVQLPVGGPIDITLDRPFLVVLAGSATASALCAARSTGPSAPSSRSPSSASCCAAKS
jgi:hypothetical protein